MSIEGKITGMKYEVLLEEELQVFDIANFDINYVPPYCIIVDDKFIFSLLPKKIISQ